MIKLRVDWHQACQSCGTEVVVDYLDQCPKEILCPWCGAKVLIDIKNGNLDARERLTSALFALESQMNQELTRT
ncbi:MAG TPA: hypothetical protein PLU88_06915 [Armatimonadota bacterium]|nr:hypothetical protein [Armatimonadota bacterium]